VEAADPVHAEKLQGFFKTGKGEYGEGDIFIGVKVPVLRSIAKKYTDLKLTTIHSLLQSKIHEYRFIALLILIHQFNEGNIQEKKEIVDFYIKHTTRINNWDLVDISAPQIVGSYYLGKNSSRIQQLAKSPRLWDRRIAIVSTHTFIKQNEFALTLNIVKHLLKDKEDLIHKACGWMLREVGKRNKQELVGFLDEYCTVMPRTMLRYSLEHFSQEERTKFMKR